MPRRLSILLAAAAAFTALAVPAPVAAASPGWLDPSFGRGGVVTVPRANPTPRRCGRTVGIAVAPTGRSFVGAAYCGPDGDPSEVTAFTRSGRIDTSFASGRPLFIDFDTNSLEALFARADGGLVVHVADGASAECDRISAYGAGGTPDPVLWRRCLPAKNDPLQYTIGQVTRLPGGSFRDCARGYEVDTLRFHIALSGLTSAGDIDTRIGPNGIRDMPFGNCVVMTSDSAGRLYWVSRRWAREGQAVVDVHRTTQTGALDVSWGVGGLATIDMPQGNLKPVAAVAAPDGSFLVGVGVSHFAQNSNWDAGVARLRPDGSVDTAFGDTGVRVNHPPGSNGERFLALTVDSASRPILSIDVPTGSPYPHPFTTGFLTRLRASDGLPDPAFGTGGWVRLGRPLVRLAMAGPSRILGATAVRDGLVLSARGN